MWKLLGYDARLWSSEIDAAWDTARRSQFLLDTAVSRPLSVDPNVWPSMFVDRQLVERKLGFPILQPGQVLRPEFVGKDFPLWSDLKHLEDSIVSNGVQEAEICIIEVFEYIESEQPDDEHKLDFLGIDVADTGLISSLSNCGYSEAEQIKLRSKYLTYLNEWHLFPDHNIAKQFRRDSDLLVPEHAPFLLYCINARFNP